MTVTLSVPAERPVRVKVNVVESPALMFMVVVGPEIERTADVLVPVDVQT